MNKIIIGFMGQEDSGRSTAASVFKKKGFCKVSINSKVKEFASHLLGTKKINDADILELRRRGHDVNKSYWINLALTSIDTDADGVVFDDIEAGEVLSDVVKIYQIYRPDVSTLQLPDVETIVNDGSKKEFVAKITDLYNSLNNL